MHISLSKAFGEITQFHPQIGVRSGISQDLGPNLGVSGTHIWRICGARYTSQRDIHVSYLYRDIGDMGYILGSDILGYLVVGYIGYGRSLHSLSDMCCAHVSCYATRICAAIWDSPICCAHTVCMLRMLCRYHIGYPVGILGSCGLRYCTI